MASVFIKIEGIEDGALDAPEDRAVVLRYVYKRMSNKGETRGIIPWHVLTDAGIPAEHDEEDELSWWSDTDRY